MAAKGFRHHAGKSWSKISRPFSLGEEGRKQERSWEHSSEASSAVRRMTFSTWTKSEANRAFCSLYSVNSISDKYGDNGGQQREHNARLHVLAQGADDQTATFLHVMLVAFQQLRISPRTKTHINNPLDQRL